MKKIPFLQQIVIGLLIVAVVACKKESNNNTSGSDYYLKFKKNDSWVTWKNALSYLDPNANDNTKTNFSFQGANNDNSEGFGISFDVNGSSINEGSYNSDTYSMTADYTILQSNTTTTYSMKTYSVNSSSYSVTLDSITENTIKGTFTGNFLVNKDDDSDTLKISEGEFFLQRIR
ncbi:MAG: hypothetical protein QM802_06400 [Agriterribacter sp.]